MHPNAHCCYNAFQCLIFDRFLHCSSLCLVSCLGKNLANAPLHLYPGGLFGHPVGSEIHQSFAGPAVCPHSYRPSAYSHDWTPLHDHRDEMRK